MARKFRLPTRRIPLRRVSFTARNRRVSFVARVSPRPRQRPRR